MAIRRTGSFRRHRGGMPESPRAAVARTERAGPAQTHLDGTERAGYPPDHRRVAGFLQKICAY